MSKKFIYLSIFLFTANLSSMENPNSNHTASYTNKEQPAELTFEKLPTEIFVLIVNNLKNENNAKEILSSVVKFSGICSVNRKFVIAYLPELLVQVLDTEKKISLEELEKLLSTQILPNIISNGFKVYLNLSQAIDLKKASSSSINLLKQEQNKFSQNDKIKIINLCNIECLNSTDINYLFSKAIELNHEDLAKILINNGAELNAEVPLRGRPLSIAVSHNNFDMAKLLLESGAYVNIRYNAEGWTPLMIAIVNRNLPIVCLLLNEGATDNINNSIHIIDGPVPFETAIPYAVEQNDLVLLIILLKNGSNSNSLNLAFYYAVCKNNIDFMQKLLEKGANINCSGSALPPLYIAIAANNKETVQFLLANGAKQEYQTMGRRFSAAEYAFENGKTEIGMIILDWEQKKLENQAAEIKETVNKLNLSK